MEFLKSHFLKRCSQSLRTKNKDYNFADAQIHLQYLIYLPVGSQLWLFKVPVWFHLDR